MSLAFVVEAACTVAWAEGGTTPNRGMRVTTRCWFEGNSDQDIYQLQTRVRDYVAQELDHRQADTCNSPQEVVQWILHTLQSNFPALTAVECEMYPGLWIKQTVAKA